MKPIKLSDQRTCSLCGAFVNISERNTHQRAIVWLPMGRTTGGNQHRTYRIDQRLDTFMCDECYVRTEKGINPLQRSIFDEL